jgi:hypothetical protein
MQRTDFESLKGTDRKRLPLEIQQMKREDDGCLIDQV